MLDTITELAPVTIIGIFAIKEFFAWLKTRRNNNGTQKELALLKQQVNNHMTDYKENLNSLEEKYEQNRKKLNKIDKTVVRIEESFKNRR